MTPQLVSHLEGSVSDAGRCMACRPPSACPQRPSPHILEPPVIPRHQLPPAIDSPRHTPRTATRANLPAAVTRCSGDLREVGEKLNPACARYFFFHSNCVCVRAPTWPCKLITGAHLRELFIFPRRCLSGFYGLGENDIQMKSI